MKNLLSGMFIFLITFACTNNRLPANRMNSSQINQTFLDLSQFSDSSDEEIENSHLSAQNQRKSTSFPNIGRGCAKLTSTLIKGCKSFVPYLPFAFFTYSTLYSLWENSTKFPPTSDEDRLIYEIKVYELLVNVLGLSGSVLLNEDLFQSHKEDGTSNQKKVFKVFSSFSLASIIGTLVFGSTTEFLMAAGSQSCYSEIATVSRRIARNGGFAIYLLLRRCYNNYPIFNQNKPKPQNVEAVNT